ncbi:MAG: hypothetical protein IT199_04200 [Solirubrobacterales bacterium]|nr:hypothetical protein [Solirubrobacterales bacterium]
MQKIEEENAGDLTPEKIAAMEKKAALSDEADKLLVDEKISPTAGRRFTRASIRWGYPFGASSVQREVPASLQDNRR